MAKRLRAGDVIPEFRFDTPYRPQCSFYELLEGDKPVFLVFLRNFGHPLTRHYIMEYIKSADCLRSARLVCVVRTRPQTIAGAIPEGSMPYELMCDAEGVLYRFFDVPSEKSRMKCYSFKAMKILGEAKKKGFKEKKGEAQQLPLTMLVGPAGRVLMAHYGETLTDLPEDCRGMEELAADLLPGLPAEWLAVVPGSAAPAQDSFAAAFEAAPAQQPLEPAQKAAFGQTLDSADAPAQEPAPANEPAAVQGAAPAQDFNTALDFETALDFGQEPQPPRQPAPPSESPQEPAAPAIDLEALGFGAGK